MKKIWKQNVFYDTGEVMAENTPVAWMDFRAYCLDGNLYSMLFIFQMREQAVLGNFHCSFPKYDIWKPVILKIEQNGDEPFENVKDLLIGLTALYGHTICWAIRGTGLGKVK